MLGIPCIDGLAVDGLEVGTTGSGTLTGLQGIPAYWGPTKEGEGAGWWAGTPIAIPPRGIGAETDESGADEGAEEEVDGREGPPG